MLNTIREIFTEIANGREPDGAKDASDIYNVEVSGLMYEYMKTLHRCALDLSYKLVAVMEDPAHQNLMQEARENEFLMPNEDDFRTKLQFFQSHLLSYNPADVEFVPGPVGQRVRMPLHVVRGLTRTGLESAEFISHFGEALRQSEYMGWFRELKLRGTPYKGPSTFLELYKMHLTLQIVSDIIIFEAQLMNMPPDWAKWRENAPEREMFLIRP